MSAELNKQIEMKWVDTTNSRDLVAMEKLIDEILAPGCISHELGSPDTTQSFEGSKQFYRQLFADFPDYHLRVEDFIAEDDKVVSFGLITGTNPIEGEVLNTQFIHISRYSAGKLVEEWQTYVPAPAMPK